MIALGPFLDWGRGRDESNQTAVFPNTIVARESAVSGRIKL